jgi:hypothetical protein
VCFVVVFALVIDLLTEHVQPLSCTHQVVAIGTRVQSKQNQRGKKHRVSHIDENHCKSEKLGVVGVDRDGGELFFLFALFIDLLTDKVQPLSRCWWGQKKASWGGWGIQGR